jgi:hypothetical protein
MKSSGDPKLYIDTVSLMPRDFKLNRLSDEFGQYLLVIKCAACAHERRAYPNLLAHICGWNTKLADLKNRLRCSKCGRKSCHVRAIEMQKSRGTPPVH